jgi:hypothetical protein
MARYNVVRYGTVRCGTVRCGTVRYGAVRYGTVRYGTVRYGAVRYGTVRCISSHVITKLPDYDSNGCLKHVAVNDYTIFMEWCHSKVQTDINLMNTTLYSYNEQTFLITKTVSAPC